MDGQEAARALRMGVGMGLKGRQERIKGFLEGPETAASALGEIQGYRAVGTVEGFREAMEARIPEAPQEALASHGKSYGCRNGWKDMIGNEDRHNARFCQFVDRYCTEHGCTVDEALRQVEVRRACRWLTEV